MILVMRALASSESVECSNEKDAKKLEDILKAMEKSTAIPKMVHRSGRKVEWGSEYVEAED